MRSIRLVAWLVVAAVLVPALASGDVVRLVDGSTLRGRVVSLGADTLVVRATFGSEVRIPRDQIRWIGFGDSLAVPQAPAAGAGQAKAAGGDGHISVTFLKRGLSSRVVVDRHKDREAHLRANWIIERFLVDGKEVFSCTDSTMDKTIYDGPDRVYKNSMDLKDFSVAVPAGMHQCMLIVENAGKDQFRKDFDPEPLSIELHVDNVVVTAGKVRRVTVDVSHGLLRLGQPHLELVD